MLPFEDRFTRQRQLPEVGMTGQRRLESAVVELGSHPAEQVAGDYLRRAGVGVQVASRASAPDELYGTRGAPQEFCHFDGPAAYLTGCLMALSRMRQILGIESNLESEVSQKKATAS